MSARRFFSIAPTFEYIYILLGIREYLGGGFAWWVEGILLFPKLRTCFSSTSYVGLDHILRGVWRVCGRHFPSSTAAPTFRVHSTWKWSVFTYHVRVSWVRGRHGSIFIAATTTHVSRGKLPGISLRLFRRGW